MSHHHHLRALLRSCNARMYVHPHPVTADWVAGFHGETAFADVEHEKTGATPADAITALEAFLANDHNEWHATAIDYISREYRDAPFYKRALAEVRENSIDHWAAGTCAPDEFVEMMCEVARGEA